jgi:mRNA-degrading endonuclease RelE of RelBE toxin-antitoxin system
MRIERTPQFVKEYKSLDEALRKKVDKQLRLLMTNVRYPGLYARKMVSQPDLWEARVDYHYRITFKVQGDVIILRRVGTHEIYRKP